jgi:hypothetical protein
MPFYKRVLKNGLSAASSRSHDQPDRERAETKEPFFYIKWIQ